MNRYHLIISFVACFVVNAASVLKAQNPPASLPGARPEAIILFIRKDNFRKFDQLVVGVLKEQSRVNEELMRILADGRSSNNQKCASAYFLGEIHATNAVQVLA